MKQKIFIDFSKLTCTREEISDCLEVAAKAIREGHNSGGLFVGQTGHACWRLYPVRYDEANKDLVQRQNDLAMQRLSMGTRP